MRRQSFTLLFALALAACGGGGGGNNGVLPPAPPPAQPVPTPISDVQGTGSASPLEGQFVTIEGIVSGDFQDNDADATSNLGGFFVQSEVPDGDPGTSDGVFVFDGDTPATDVSTGDRVTVQGTVTEHFGETQIVARTVSVSGVGTVRTTAVTMPATATVANADGILIADLERYEGMHVEIVNTLIVADLYDLERYGAVLLTADQRTQQFTNVNEPDVAGFDASLREHAMQSLYLDDGVVVQNKVPIRYLFPDAVNRPDYSLRAGDSISKVRGNLRFSRGSGEFGADAYRLMPTEVPQFAVANPRPIEAPVTGGNLTVASFNVLNYFATIDSGERICGPSGGSRCRGADTTDEFERQHAKIVSALLAMDADIVGLMELENDANNSLGHLTDGLNQIAGPGVWSFVDTGIVGTDAIRQGFIYKTTTVTPRGAAAVLDSTVDPRFNDMRNRPAIAQTFELNSNGGHVTVAVNHLKSKGSTCDDIGDPDLLDGQGNCNQTRSNAAAALADWLATDPTSSNDDDVLILGDLNAHLREDPLATLESAGYTNLLRTVGGEAAYSYLFRGGIGALDHALISMSLADQVSGVAEWHINADEPPVLDYNLEFGRDPALFDETTPFRASDHDPVVIGLQLAAD